MNNESGGKLKPGLRFCFGGERRVSVGGNRNYAVISIIRAVIVDLVKDNWD
jgi:hypothetical protein